MVVTPARTAVGAATLVALGVLATAGGCVQSPSPPPATVRGTVTFQGRPLAGGLIVFAPDREKGAVGKPATAVIGPDGSYRLASGGAAGVPPGWYRVAIADAPGAAPDTNTAAFPASLRRPDKSGIEREVRIGVDHVFPFEIDVSE